MTMQKVCQTTLLKKTARIAKMNRTARAFKEENHGANHFSCQGQVWSRLKIHQYEHPVLFQDPFHLAYNGILLLRRQSVQGEHADYTVKNPGCIGQPDSVSLNDMG